MSRSVDLHRYEAEILVDLIEGHAPGDRLMMRLAQEIREEWGMEHGVIDWLVAPSDAEGWGRDAKGPFWWQMGDPGKPSIRTRGAPQFLPDDPRVNLHYSRGQQP